MLSVFFPRVFSGYDGRPESKTHALATGKILRCLLPRSSTNEYEHDFRKVADHLLKETDRRAEELHVSRTDYIRKALETMNIEMLRRERSVRLKEVSQRVREESMRVNAEFARIETAPDV